MESQDGVILPFTYFGTGKFTNMRETKNKVENKEVDTLTFDIVLDNEVSNEYFLDFEIPNNSNNN